MIAAGFGSFHRRNPFVVITEEWKIEKWTCTVRLGADGQLCQHPTHRLHTTTILGTGDGVLEPFVRLVRVHIRRRRTRKAGNGFVVGLSGRVSQQVTEVLVEGEELVGRAVENFDDLGGGHVIDDKERRLWVGVLSAQRADVLACVTIQADKPTLAWCVFMLSAAVTREIKLFQTYFDLRRRPSETISFQRVDLKLAGNYFKII